jgi:hypothetical protein
MEVTTMAINFTNNIEQYTSIQRATKAKQFMEFTSKKQLQDAEVLTDKELKFVTSIKGTFNFALHNDGRYMAVTLYRANAEKKYNFLVLDLQSQAIAEVSSIKVAKAEILELVELDNQPAEAEEDPQEEEMDEAMEAEDAETASAVQGVLNEFLGEQPAEEKKSRKSKNA